MDRSMKKPYDYKYLVEVFIMYVLLNPGFLYLIYLWIFE